MILNFRKLQFAKIINTYVFVTIVILFSVISNSYIIATLHSHKYTLTLAGGQTCIHTNARYMRTYVRRDIERRVNKSLQIDW